MNLQTPVKQAGRMFSMYAKRLEKLGVKTLEDLLYYFPFRYEDYSMISTISQVQEGETVTIQGSVREIKNTYTRNFKTIQKAIVADGTGNIEATWFNQPFLTRIIHQGDTVSLSGRIDFFASKLILQSPDYEVLHNNAPSIHTGRLVPIYSETKGVSSKWIRRQIYKLLEEQKTRLPADRQNMFEYIPDSIIQKYHFDSVTKSLEQIHFPKNSEEAKKAKYRLSFDELFLLSLAAFQRRNQWQNSLSTHPFSITSFKTNIVAFWDKLPFELTNAQKRAVKEIFGDLARNKPMNRLLEGDVGSGKTVVSAIAMYLAHLNGFQSVLMAPTQILAQQHYNTISNLLSPLGVKVDLVTGTHRIRNQESGIKKTHDSQFIIHNSRSFNILVGTHAVLSKKLKFDSLGLVVIDEQQRFGVEQRAIIRKKGDSPHLLTMTATPIPRTVALTLYGDLDFSYLDEMPKGRRVIKTWLVPLEKRENAYRWVEKQIKETDSQAFIICPFIEQSESMQTVKAAISEFERLKKEIFPKLRLGLLHGKLKAKDKDNILTKFRNKELDILVATPVVEVGIDIPNATIILIETSERFGLAQLHQLRGRVGRGDKQSYCLLFTDSKNDQTLYRLKAMETIHIGAELAQLDLKLRGPGDPYGTLQHGRKLLKIASFSDYPLIETTRTEAEKIFPKLSDYPLLEEKLKSITLQEVAPD